MNLKVWKALDKATTQDGVNHRSQLMSQIDDTKRSSLNSHITMDSVNKHC